MKKQKAKKKRNGGRESYENKSSRWRKLAGQQYLKAINEAAKYLQWL